MKLARLGSDPFQHVAKPTLALQGHATLRLMTDHRFGDVVLQLTSLDGAYSEVRDLRSRSNAYRRHTRRWWRHYFAVEEHSLDVEFNCVTHQHLDFFDGVSCANAPGQIGHVGSKI